MVSPVHGDYRRLQAETPLIVLSKFPEPALEALKKLASSRHSLVKRDRNDRFQAGAPAGRER